MTKNLSYPFIFTGLGFLINSLVDKGEKISVQEMYSHIENRTVWTLLEDKLSNRWLGLWNDVQRNEMMDYFASSANAIDAEDKYGVVNNGYCLLVAYLFEAGQSGEKSGWFPSISSK